MRQNKLPLGLLFAALIGLLIADGISGVGPLPSSGPARQAAAFSLGPISEAPPPGAAVIAPEDAVPESTTISAFTTVPKLVNLQGRLTDSVGNPVADGTYSVRFSIWNAQAPSGAEQWNETKSVTTSGGLFNTFLGPGGTPSLTKAVFDGELRYLEVKVGADPPMTPRQQFMTVPYAFFAEEANLAADLSCTDCVSGSEVQFNYAGSSSEGGIANNSGLLDGIDSTGFWKLAGNSGTAPGTAFLGTTDNQPLELRVNNARALRLEPNFTPNIIGGSSLNSVTAGARGATISGGGDVTFGENRVTDNFGTVGGGFNNQAGDNAGTTGNQTNATVGGGRDNTASALEATVSGGGGNIASSTAATVGGGWDNRASDQWATVPGGRFNVAGGGYSFAAGRRANARHVGSFVWGDSTDADIASSANDEFTVRAGGGFRLFGDLTFPDDFNSITFPPADATNDPMINMFATGTGNADRMVIAHSPGFTNWGLQYQDVGDKFRFLSAGNPVLTVDLGNSDVFVGGGLCVDDPGTAAACPNPASGAILADGAITANAFDLAERFNSRSSDLEAGDLVILDANAEVRLADGTPYDQRLVGIVSANPGLVLGWESGNDVLVTLAGRVPLKVTLESGSIAVGDYLTSSSTPGYAMRASEPGATIGIALEGFDGSQAEKGQVLTFVSLGERNSTGAVQALERAVNGLEQRVSALETALGRSAGLGVPSQGAPQAAAAEAGGGIPLLIIVLPAAGVVVLLLAIAVRRRLARAYAGWRR